MSGDVFRRRWPVAVVGLFVAALLLSRVPAATGLPSFTRSTGIACAGCHENGPQLNSQGLEYLARGYRMLGAHPTPPAPLRSLSAEGGVGVGVTAEELSGPHDFDETLPRRERASMLELHSAGAWDPRWSWHLEQRVGTTSGTLETRTAAIDLENLVPDGKLGLRVGRFEGGLPFLSASRRPMLAPYRMPVSLDVGGAELDGQDAGWDYAVGVTTDHRSTPGGPEPMHLFAHMQDTYGWVSREFAGQRIGARMWFDRQDSDLPRHRWLQHMQHEVAASLHAGRVDITPAYMLDRYDDRPAAELHDKHHLALLEVSTPVGRERRWWMSGRIEHEYRTLTPITPEHDVSQMAFDVAFDARPDTRLALEWSHLDDNLGGPAHDALDAFIRVGH